VSVAVSTISITHNPEFASRLGLGWYNEVEGFVASIQITIGLLPSIKESSVQLVELLKPSLGLLEQ